MARNSFYTLGNSKEHLAFSLQKLIELSKATGKNALLIWPTLRVGGTTLEQVLGSSTLKQFVKDRRIQIDSGPTRIELVTWSTAPTRWDGPALLAYPDKKTLDKIDGIYSITDLIVNAWNPNELDEWVKTWGAVDLASGTAVADLPLSPVLEEALIALTHRVNLSTGLGHPNDRAAAVDLFKILKSGRYTLDQDAIKRWLIRNNWRPQDAEEVRRLVEAMNNGRAVRGRRAAWAPNILEQFKERAKAGGPADP